MNSCGDMGLCVPMQASDEIFDGYDEVSGPRDLRRKPTFARPTELTPHLFPDREFKETDAIADDEFAPEHCVESQEDRDDRVCGESNDHHVCTCAMDDPLDILIAREEHERGDGDDFVEDETISCSHLGSSQKRVYVSKIEKFDHECSHTTDYVRGKESNHRRRRKPRRLTIRGGHVIDCQ